MGCDTIVATHRCYSSVLETFLDADVLLYKNPIMTIYNDMANKKSIKGTQTEKNLVISYLNESQAYARYTFYGAQANKEKYFPIEKAFNDTAANELRHAKVFFKFLEGGVVEADLGADAGVIGDTATNLEISIGEEKKEGVEAYIAFAKTAKEEGFPEIAEHFTAIAEIERHHLGVSSVTSNRSRMALYGNVTRPSNGNVLCADISTRGKSHLKSAPHATIPASTISPLISIDTIPADTTDAIPPRQGGMASPLRFFQKFVLSLQSSQMYFH